MLEFIKIYEVQLTIYNHLYVSTRYKNNDLYLVDRKKPKPE